MNDAFTVLSRAIDARLSDPARSGDHFEAFVELLHLKAVYGLEKDASVIRDEHQRLGSPAPDSGHRFWRMPGGMTAEDIAYWNAMMEKWKSGVAELQAKGLTPRLD